jgi:hypothetical protein
MIRYLLVIFIASLFSCVTGCSSEETRGNKVTHDGTTHGFLIGFECVQVEWYIDDTKVDVFRITRSPKPTFDHILKAANVPLAENSGGVD